MTDISGMSLEQLIKLVDQLAVQVRGDSIDVMIQSWHSKAEIDYFGYYMYEYLAFIAFLRRKLFPAIDRERQVIQRLKRETRVRDGYFLLIEKSDALRVSLQNLKNELDRIGLSGGDGWWNNETDDKDDRYGAGTISGLNDWPNIIEILYQVRNNLFHGGKDPNDERDRILVENSYVALRHMVNLLLTLSKA